MDALSDVIPFVLFAVFVLARLVRAGRAKPAAGPTGKTKPAAASSGSGFDLNALLRALDEAANPQAPGAPPPLPASVTAEPVTPAVTPMHTRGFDPSHFTEDDAFTEPGIFREVHLPVKPHGKAPPRTVAPRSTPGAARTRLRDPAALREAFVLQTILERRHRR